MREEEEIPLQRATAVALARDSPYPSLVSTREAEAVLTNRVKIFSLHSESRKIPTSGTDLHLLCDGGAVCGREAGRESSQPSSPVCPTNT